MFWFKKEVKEPKPRISSPIVQLGIMIEVHGATKVVERVNNPSFNIPHYLYTYTSETPVGKVVLVEDYIGHNRFFDLSVDGLNVYISKIEADYLINICEKTLGLDTNHNRKMLKEKIRSMKMNNITPFSSNS